MINKNVHSDQLRAFLCQFRLLNCDALDLKKSVTKIVLKTILVDNQTN